MSPITRQRLGFLSFRMLGGIASNAVPELIRIYDAHPNQSSQTAIPIILGGIGPAARPASHLLLRAVVHGDANARTATIYSLGQVGVEPKLAVPVLIQCLIDPDPSVKRSAAQVLGWYGKQAKPAVPALLEALKEEREESNALAVETILNALKIIDPEAVQRLKVN